MKSEHLSWILGLIIIIVWGIVFLISIAVYDTMTRSAEPHWRTVRIAILLISLFFVTFGFLIHKRLMIRFHKKQFAKLADKLDGELNEHLFKLILTSPNVEIVIDFYNFYIELKNIDSPTIQAIRIFKKWHIQVADLTDEQKEQYTNHLVDNLIRLKRTRYDIWKILTVANDNKRIYFVNYEMKAEPMLRFIQDIKLTLESKVN